jgi:hypothetical protein
VIIGRRHQEKTDLQNRPARWFTIALTAFEGALSMKVHHWIAILLAMWVLGCKSETTTTKETVTSTAATPDQIQSIRAAYKAQNPNVDVGVVQDVLESENLAAFGDVNVADFKEGQTVCFVDVTTAPLVCGKVVRITADQVHVKYENPTANHRSPMKGDLAVAFH